MAEKETKDKQRTEKPLDKMTVVELREIAKEIPDVTGVSGMKKDQLLAIVKEARGIEEEKPAKKKPAKKKTAKKKGSTPVKEMTVKELKAEIARLRAEKEELRKEGDRKKIDALRRRINRMKKKTRKAA
jgi:hypothetical protein